MENSNKIANIQGKIQELVDEISALEEKKDANPNVSKLKELHEQIKEKAFAKDALGIFDFKQKKALADGIATLEQEANKLMPEARKYDSAYDVKIKEINLKINSLRDEIAELK